VSAVSLALWILLSSVVAVVVYLIKQMVDREEKGYFSQVNLSQVKRSMIVESQVALS
jgi:NADH:ubiquinone oxidoreductase subunit 2 (subunit N)